MWKYLKLLIVCLFISCGSSISFSYNSSIGIYTQEQIDSIYQTEGLVGKHWVTFKLADYETKDTAYIKVYYIDMEQNPIDSIVGIKYTHRIIDSTQYFFKQIIIDNNKRLKK